MSHVACRASHATGRDAPRRVRNVCKDNNLDNG